MAKKYKQKELAADPVYNDVLVAKFTNHIMKKGKKFLAMRIVNNAFELIKNREKQEPLDVFRKAISAVGPNIEVRPQRVGGATYQVPRPVKDKRKVSLAMRWILEAARKKKGRPMEEKLAQELILASKNEGEAVKKKLNSHRMAEANRAFAYLAR